MFILSLLAVSLHAQDRSDSLPPSPPLDTVHRVVDSTPPPRKRKVIIADTTKPDTSIAIVTRVIPISDSVSRRPIGGAIAWELNRNLAIPWQVLFHHPFFDFAAKPLDVRESEHRVHGKEMIFYVLMALLLVFALLKQAFGKYFYDVFRVFFRTTMKQRQIREQLMQTQLPSLFFNIYFVATTGLYIDFMLQYFHIAPIDNFWLLYFYCCIGLAVIYTGKFIGLKIIGWLLNMKKAADSYIFIVFIINKVIGIFLLPFLVVLAFAGEPVFTIGLVLSWCGIGALLLYRLVLGFAAIRNEVRFNLFHFVLYLGAFEITPLLLIYRLLLVIFNRSHA